MLTRRTMLGLSAAALCSPAYASQPVSSAIACALDYSSSMQPGELGWMLAGMRDVIASERFSERIEASLRRQVAVCFYWFATKPQVPIIPWRLLRADDGSVARLADDLDAIVTGQVYPSGIGQATKLDAAVDFGVGQLMGGMPWEADRLVVDVQSDGTNSGGVASLHRSRDRADALGVEVNAIVVGTDTGYSEERLRDYYHANLVTSIGRVYVASDAESFRKAWSLKIFMEMV